MFGEVFILTEINVYEKENLSLIKDLIENHGNRLTYQRKQILMEFINNKEKHLSVEEINNILKDEKIGISTIYRTANLFTKLGILKEFKVDDTSYYELKMYARKLLHIHFKCKKCGDIKDIVDREIILKHLKTNKLIEEKYSLEINDVDIMYCGLCTNCINRR